MATDWSKFTPIDSGQSGVDWSQFEPVQPAPEKPGFMTTMLLGLGGSPTARVESGRRMVENDYVTSVKSGLAGLPQMAATSFRDPAAQLAGAGAAVSDVFRMVRGEDVTPGEAPEQVAQATQQTLQDSADYWGQRRRDFRAQLSPEAQAIDKESQRRYEQEGLMSGLMHQLSNPSSIGRLLAESAPGTAAAMLGGRFGLRGVAGTTMTMGAGEAMADARDAIMSMPENEIAKVPAYQRALEATGGDKFAARNLLSEAARPLAGSMGAGAGAIPGIPGLNPVEQLIARTGTQGVMSGLLRSRVGRAAAEAVGEVPEEVGITLGSNLGQRAAGLDVDPMEGLAQAAGGAILAGGAMGAMMPGSGQPEAADPVAERDRANADQLSRMEAGRNARQSVAPEYTGSQFAHAMRQAQDWQQAPVQVITDGFDLLSGKAPEQAGSRLDSLLTRNATLTPVEGDPFAPNGSTPLPDRENLPETAIPETQAGVEAQPDAVSVAAAQAAPDPTDAQKDAGNYRKGHVRLAGMDVSIENPAGSERSGTDADGNPWSVQMQSHYGYIRGTTGKDGDHIDAFIRPGYEGDADTPVFVIDQNNADGSFDEHKVMLGFNDEAEARQAYEANYSEGWQGFGGVRRMSMGEFKEWSKRPRLTKQPVIKPGVVPYQELGIPEPKPRNKVRKATDFDPVHHDLLDWIALRGGVNRAAFEAEGVDPAQWRTRAAQAGNQRFFGKPVFRKDSGMTPDDLREAMAEMEWLSWEDYADDAVQMVMSAINQGEVFKLPPGQEADTAIEAWERDTQGREQEQELARELGYASPQAMYDDIAYAESTAAQREEADDDRRLADRLEAGGEGPGSQAPIGGFEGVREAGPEGRQDDSAVPEGTGGLALQAGPQPSAVTPASQAGLFPPPTAQETIAAERQRRQDETDGRNATGRTDMLAGDGELFAGPRPEQADIESVAPSTELRDTAAIYGETRPLPDRQRVESSAAAAAASPGPGAVQQLDMFVRVRGENPVTFPRLPQLRKSAKLVTTGQFQTGIDRVSRWEDAAHIVAPLRKSPQEQLAALVLDAQHRPLAVVRHGIGTVDGASVEPWSLLGAIASVPGARSVYFAHNHPSGLPSQSVADLNVTKRLSEVMDGSGIAPKGMIVVAPGSKTATYFDSLSGGSRDIPGEVTTARRTASVPMQERRLHRIVHPTQGITSPHEVPKALPDPTLRESGVLLLDTRHNVLGTIPAPTAEMARLRTGSPDRGTARILSEIARANAPAVIIYGTEIDAAKNLGEMLSRADVRVLDIAISDGRRWELQAQFGRDVRTHRPFFSQPATTQIVEDADATDGWTLLAGHPDVFQLPKSQADTVEGIFAETMPDGFTITSANELAGQIEFDEATADKAWRIRTPQDEVATLYQGEGRVWIDVSALSPGQDGKRIYNAVANYAHNTRQTFIGDPAGLSDAALFRRLENMLSSALKFNTTRHLFPHERQTQGSEALGVPPIRWRNGDDAHNLRELLYASYQAVASQAPAIREMTYNPDTQRFERADGSEVTDEQFHELAAETRRASDRDAVERESRRLASEGVHGAHQLAAEIGAGQPVEGTSGIGRATLKRAVLTHALLSGDGASRSGLLAFLGGQRSSRDLAPSLRRLLYSAAAAEVRWTNASAQGIGTARLQRAVDRIQSKWKGDQPNVEVIATADGFPAWVKAHDGWQDAEGLYDPFTQTVYLVAGNLSSIHRGVQVLTHEVIGHHGIEAIVGPETWAWVAGQVQIMRTSGKHAALFDDIHSRYSQNDPAYLKEVVAVMAERGIGTSIIDRIAAAVRRFLSSMGLRSPDTADGIRKLIIAAARHVERRPAERGADPAADPLFAINRGTTAPVATDETVAGRQGDRAAGDDTGRGATIDETTGLPLNDDGTVTVYHHTSAESAAQIRQTGRLRSAGEPDVYVTTRAETDTGYGDTAVAIRVDPARLEIDDEFPDGRRDFRMTVGRPGGSIPVVVENDSTAPDSDGAMFARPKGQRQHTAEQLEFLTKAGLKPDERTWLRRIYDTAIDTARGIVDSLRERDAIKQAIFDRFHGIRSAYQASGWTDMREMEGYVSARLSTGLPAVMEAIMMHGAPEWRDGILSVKDDTKGLLDSLAPVKDSIDDWLGWMVARRAQALKRQGRENLMTAADIAAGLDLAKGREQAFEQAALDYLTLKNAILDVAEKAGLIDPAKRAVWDHAEYIPFYRQDADSIGPGTRKGLSNQSSGIKALRGGSSGLADPLGNIVRNFTRLIDASMKNNAMLEVQRDVPQFFEKLPAVEFKQALVPMDQIRKHLTDAGMDPKALASLPPGTLNGIRELWAVQPPAADDVVRIMRNGKAEHYRIEDPLLLRSLSAFTVSMPGWMRPLVWAKRILTAGATGTAEFVGANFIRDSLEGWMVANDNLKPMVDSMRGALGALKSDAGTQELMMAGSYFAHGQIYGHDPDATAIAMRRSLRAKGVTNKDLESFVGSVARGPAWLWDRWTQVQSGIEHGTRRALQDAALKAGRSRKQAAFEAKDLLDFSMRGDSQVLAFFIDSVPFLNARLQGMYKLGRSYASNRRQMALRGSMLASATIGLLAWNLLAHRDEYDKLEEWDKDMYWHIGPGTDYHTRIPKPFELGIVFGTAPERGVRAMLNLAGTEAGDRPAQTFQAMMHALGHTLAFNPIPQALMPIAESMMNRSFFTGRAIENLSDGRMNPESRRNWYTSDTAQLVPAWFANTTGLSPKRIEHLWRGYTAGLGAYAMRMSDWLVRQASDAPDRPAMHLRDYPLAGRFFRGSAPPRSTSYQTEFYRLKEKAEQLEGTVKDYLARAPTEGQHLADRAVRMIQENPDLLGPSQRRRGAKAGVSFTIPTYMRRVQDRLSLLRNEEEHIALSRDMTPREKRDRIDELVRQRNDLLEDTVKMLRAQSDQSPNSDPN